ncbi:hypothetical protein GCM10010441_49600 [Kitasatospora paracochleata]|uniref:DUF2214 domain-containing protein n=1 Tax=Kitasatospora paracochleata TaxID=58354 RepID=A0ABT1ISP2_9ACTN|nr:hypothetical protein [Kitasatospora paracochleata]MCP2308151.1 hypothetical protein [Kitasatospora paracochleata]
MPQPEQFAAPLAGTAARCVAVSFGLAGMWAASAWTAGHLHADPSLHTAALFVHLATLVVGFGAVLAIDYLGLLWLLGRRTLRQVVDFTAPLHVPVWAGLAGLTFSGILLEPHLDSPLTWLKLVLVLAIALNGVHATALHQRLEEYGDTRPPHRLLGRGAASALISQVGWWGSVAIGFWNAQH